MDRFGGFVVIVTVLAVVVERLVQVTQGDGRRCALLTARASARRVQTIAGVTSEAGGDLIGVVAGVQASEADVRKIGHALRVGRRAADDLARKLEDDGLAWQRRAVGIESRREGSVGTVDAARGDAAQAGRAKRLTISGPRLVLSFWLESPAKLAVSPRA